MRLGQTEIRVEVSCAEPLGCGRVAEHKFVCLMNSEAKLTNVSSELGKVYCKDRARRMGSSCSKTLNSGILCLSLLYLFFLKFIYFWLLWFFVAVCGFL